MGPRGCRGFSGGGGCQIILSRTPQRSPLRGSSPGMGNFSHSCLYSKYLATGSVLPRRGAGESKRGGMKDLGGPHCETGDARVLKSPGVTPPKCHRCGDSSELVSISPSEMLDSFPKIFQNSSCDSSQTCAEPSGPCRRTFLFIFLPVRSAGKGGKSPKMGEAAAQGCPHSLASQLCRSGPRLAINSPKLG